MADLSREQLARQALLHLESLKAAGVDWIPKAKAKPATRAPEAPTPAIIEPPIASLFEAPAPVAGPLSPDQRRQELEVLTGVVKPCSRCGELAATRTQTVFGVGRIDPDVCFIGEAPGADEDRQGEPFVGAAGQLLNKILAACGFTREDVYICNILKCRPPGNRTPRPDEAANCREYLDRQLELVRPKTICCLGGCAAQNLLGVMTPLGKLRGRFHDYKGIPVICTYHPAYLLPHRQPEKKKEVWEDMQTLMRKLGREVAKGKT
jgi:uracil-DNA glycosylase family 4